MKYLKLKHLVILVLLLLAKSGWADSVGGCNGPMTTGSNWALNPFLSSPNSCGAHINNDFPPFTLGSYNRGTGYGLNTAVGVMYWNNAPLTNAENAASAGVNLVPCGYVSWQPVNRQAFYNCIQGLNINNGGELAQQCSSVLLNLVKLHGYDVSTGVLNCAYQTSDFSGLANCFGWVTSSGCYYSTQWQLLPSDSTGCAPAEYSCVHEFNADNLLNNTQKTAIYQQYGIESGSILCTQRSENAVGAQYIDLANAQCYPASTCTLAQVGTTKYSHCGCGDGVGTKEELCVSSGMSYYWQTAGCTYLQKPSI